MKRTIFFLIISLSCLFAVQFGWASDRYNMTFNQINKDKAVFDDASSYYEKIGWYKNVLPESLYNKLTFDKDEMKELWAEAVGFKAPEVVGKIAPEIKPGKYSVEDKEKFPFKELMPPHYYNRFNTPGADGINHICNFTEFEIVPTRQYYYASPIAKATIKNAGKTKQDDKGYYLYKTYISGLPFPKPSGEHKAWQILYNYKENYHDFETTIEFDRSVGIDRNFKQDMENNGPYTYVKTSSRLVMEPLGWFDNPAKKMEEKLLIHYEPLSPRDEYGNIYFTTLYAHPEKDPRIFVYMNVIRRIRKMSSSDRQDQSIGSDQTYDDLDGFMQPLRSDEYSYKISLIDEREFLVPAATLTGKQWVSSKEKYIMKDMQFERRPMWVIELKQTDPNYIYSKRIMYVDRETLDIWLIENYDQKGRLYRTYSTQWAFIPEMGVLTKFNDIMLDYIDVHSTLNPIRYFPAPWVSRQDISVKSMMRKK